MVPLSLAVARTTSSMSRTIESKSAVESGWNTIAAASLRGDVELGLELDVGRAHREQPVRGGAGELALAGDHVEEAHERGLSLKRAA